MTPDAAGLVRRYHDRTKHHLNRYARSRGSLDWANQPDPFRRFAGCECLRLDQLEQSATPTYDSLYVNEPIVAEPIDRRSISRLFLHSLAISAWKQSSPTHSWSLRINPSSGALHPTEGYLISGEVQGLIDSPGVFHYSPWRHELERRCALRTDEWSLLAEQLPANSLLVALSSIYWRESWKYGERAFRYCQHDVGHAIGAIAFAARTLGWEARLLPQVAASDLNTLIGAHLQSGMEAEHADCLLALTPATSPTRASSPQHDWLRNFSFPPTLRSMLVQKHWHGKPNVLSAQHQEWPIIDEVANAIYSAEDVSKFTLAEEPAVVADAVALPDRGHSAEQIIRQRRSAVDMDGATPLSSEDFFRILWRTVPTSGRFPFNAWPYAPRNSLLLFVHRVQNLTPGLYILVRSPAHESSLRRAFRAEWDWSNLPGCPSDLPLFCLKEADAQAAAKTVSCHQDIASDGAFAVSLLAEFDAAFAEHGPSFYPRLFWETGLIGQVLYLEAEAAGVRGTGIGCYFDDAVHQMLGVSNHQWQSLYHFTIGGPVSDVRLKTLKPYHHIQSE